MSDTSLDTLARKYTGLGKEELQSATWEEIDEIARKKKRRCSGLTTHARASLRG